MLKLKGRDQTIIVVDLPLHFFHFFIDEVIIHIILGFILVAIPDVIKFIVKLNWGISDIGY